MKHILLTILGSLCITNSYAQAQPKSFTNTQFQSVLTNGTNLRGNIQTSDPYTKNVVPLPRAVIILYIYNPKTKKYDPLDKTTSNDKGYFYFYNVNPENYFLRVNNLKNYSIVVSKRDPKKQFQDLPVLKF